MRNNQKKKGFTLIELIVVIAILGILATVAVPKLSGFQTSAKKKADIASARVLVDAAQAAVADEATITGGASLADTGLTNYVNTWPVCKTVPTGTMTLILTSGVFSVTDGTNTIYPVASATYQ